MDTGTRSRSATVLRWRSSRALIAGVAVAFAVAACGPSTGASPSAAVSSAPVAKCDACRQRQRSAAVRRGDQGGTDRGA